MLMFKVTKIFPFYRRESLGELKKAVETLACGSCSHSISRSPKLPLQFLTMFSLFFNLKCYQFSRCCAETLQL